MNTGQASNSPMSNTHEGVLAPRGGLVNALKVTGLLALPLILGSLFVDWDSLVGLNTTLNDQVGYVSVARNWADSGTLNSNLIYPSVLTQNVTRNSLYMPGHYWVLGATYKLIGYSVAHSLLPSLFALVLSTVMMFVIGSQLYTPAVAYLGCALFLFFPLNLIYAFTAMAEMTAVAAGLVAFAVFLRVPPRWKPLVGPLLLVLPMAFRETGAAIAVLMAPMIFQQSRQRWRPVALFGALTLVVVGLVVASPLSTGRPSLLQANVFGGSDAVYSDAFALATFHPHLGDWGRAIGTKVLGNLHTLLLPRSWIRPEHWLEYGSMLFLLTGIPVGLGWWPRHRRPDRLFLGVAGMVLVIVLFILSLYTVWKFRGVRVLLVAQPFVALLYAVRLKEFPKRLPAARHISEFAVVGAAVIGLSAAYNVFQGEQRINQQSARDTAFLESLGLDDRGLLVSPYWLSLDYVHKHHPVRWAFPPTNRATLRLLNERYPIGAVILPVAESMTDYTQQAVRPSDVAQIGLRDEGRISYRGFTFAVFKRAGAQPATVSDTASAWHRRR